ncbi:TPA: hypothetical protein ACN7MJ_002564 [Klebsiella pneumoniae]
MEFRKESFGIPIATLALGLLFCAVYSFKVGESYFYDYPSYYIYLSIPDVINVALKAILLYMVVIAIYLALMSWELAVVSFFWGACFSALIKLYAMFKLYLSGEDHILLYVNKGMTPLLFALLGYLFSKSFSDNKTSISFHPRIGVFAFLVFLSLNFFIGLNYHSFFPNSTWQTEDGKVLVGTYKESLLFRQCAAGRSFFYLEEDKGQKLEMFAINTSGVLGLRCM